MKNKYELIKVDNSFYTIKLVTENNIKWYSFTDKCFVEENSVIFKGYRSNLLTDYYTAKNKYDQLYQTKTQEDAADVLLLNQEVKEMFESNH